MRISFFGLGVVLAVLVSGCYEKGDKETSGPFYRHHFIGMTDLSKGTNTTKLKEVWGLKSSAELRQEVLDKLAGAPREFWRKQLPANAPDQKELVRPLLDDLVNAESYLEIRGPVSRAEGVLAVRLSKERLVLWNTNLWKLVAGWKAGAPAEMQAGAYKSWGIKRKEDAGVAQVVLAGDWILVGIGQGQLTLLPALVDQAGKSGRPAAALANNSLLALDIDLVHLRTWFPFLAQFKMPPTHVELIGKGEYVRTEARMRFSEKIPWKFEPWKLPTNSISEPLASFTVGQGIAPLLPELKGMPQLGLKNYPNQFCIWNLATTHFLNFASVPMPNASNVVKQIAPRLPDLLKTILPDPPGQIGLVSNRAEVVWGGLPMIAPYIKAVQSGGLDYLVWGSFPFMQKTNSPPPAELFAQFMGRNDLMYYDWEITQQGLLHARQMWQMYDILQNRKMAGPTAASSKWVGDAAPHLGNSITEVTMATPNELGVVRKSHVGFTGFELMLLTRWFDSAAFPFNYEPMAKLGTGTRKPTGVRTNLPGARPVPPRTNITGPRTIAPTVRTNATTPKLK